MVTTRSKRWNGKFESLPADYLKEVMAKMADYGDRVQFSLIGGNALPSYQVMNAAGKAMAFDKNHHLLQAQGDEFTGVNASPLFTLDQIKAGISGAGIRSAGSARTTRVVRAGSGGTRVTAAMLNDQFANQRYEYFKSNRQTLPPSISQYSEEITELMKNGKPVEEAFGEVIKKHY